jgi:hypothetical protein
MAFKTYAEAATAFRRYLNDTPQLNELDEDYESTDDELGDFIKDTLNDININYEPKTQFKLTDIIVEPGVDQGDLPWSIVKTGALLQLLTAKGVHSARNMLTFSDAGGVSITNHDKWGRYINYYNVLINKYEKSVQQLKIRVNVNNAYGGFSSPFSFDVY